MIKNKEQKKIKKPFEERIAIWVGSKSSLYIHTTLFLSSFLLILLGVPADRVLLILTTIVSLEAIYLAIFIQMTVNKNTESLEEVEEGLDEIQEDIEGIQEDVEDIQEDVDEIQEDIDEIEEEVDDIEEGDNKRDRQVDDKFKSIDKQLEIILQEIKSLKNNK